MLGVDAEKVQKRGQWFWVVLFVIYVATYSETTLTQLLQVDLVS